MAEVLLSVDELTILGGPTSRNVDFSFGPSGDRGSRIFVGEGNPNTVDIGQSILPFDMYINLLASDLEYLYLYQYFNVDGQLQWNRVLRLIPNTFLSTQTKTFESGKTIFFVPVVNVVPLSEVGNITEQNFNIQHTVINDKATASSITVGNLIVSSDQLVLPVTVNAVEFNGATWDEVSGDKVVQLLVTIA